MNLLQNEMNLVTDAKRSYVRTTTHHLRFIQNNYLTMSDSEMAHELGTSYNFIQGFRRRNNLTKCQKTWQVIGGQKGGRPKKNYSNSKK